MMPAMVFASRTDVSRLISSAVALSRAGSLVGLAVVLAAAATPRQCLPGQLEAQVVSEEVSGEASVAVSTAVADVVGSAAASAAVAAASGAAATLAVVTVALPMDSLETHHQDLVMVAAVATAIETAVSIVAVAPTMTGQVVVAIDMATEDATGTVVGLGATWNLSDLEEKVGIAMTEAGTETENATTGTTIDRGKTTTGSEVSMAATRTPGSCVATKPKALLTRNARVKKLMPQPVFKRLLSSCSTPCRQIMVRSPGRLY